VNGRTFKILMITEACGGGAGRHVLDLCEGLLARDCEVHLLHAPGRADRFFRDRLGRLPGLCHASYPMRRGIHPADAAAARWVRRYVRACGPFDVIHGHSAKGGALARLAAWRTGTPALYTLHGFVAMDPSVSPVKRRVYHALEWTLSRVSDRIIAVSPEEQRFCVRAGLGRSRVVMIPNGIPPIAFPARRKAREALGLHPDTFVAGFIGRLVDPKAPDVLVEAMAAVPGHCRAVVVGAGPLEDALHARAARLGVSDRILWLGERDGTAVLPAFDVLAVPSRKEGLPYVVLEGLAAGRPVVATSAAGVECLVRHGHNGLVVPPDRPDLFARALTELSRDPERVARLACNASLRADEFTLDRMVDRTLAEYRACARPSRRNVRIPQRPTPSTTQPRKGEPVMAAKPRSAELHPGPGFRVKLQINRPDADLTAQFQDFATPDISDLLNRLYAVDPTIRCLTAGHHRLCGPACTVKVFPGDNLMVHKVLDVARPGDVVVIDAGGSPSNAVLGDLISTKAKHRGIAGFIVDGLVRDLPSIQELDFPVFARGTTPIGPLHRGPGEINFPICCGGIVVNPGDLVVADAAGVIVVPQEIAEELLGRLQRHQESNVAYFESVRRGQFSNQWVDRLLEEQGCPVIAPAPRVNGNGAHVLVGAASDDV
jgi:RraA family protein